MKYLLIFLLSGLAQASLKDLKTPQEKSFEAQPQTKNVILIFWATWCPSCRHKLADILPKAKLDAETQLIAVNTESEVEKVKNFIVKEEIKTPVVFDTEKKLRKEINQFKTPAWAVFKISNGTETLVKTASGFDEKEINQLVGKAVF